MMLALTATTEGSDFPKGAQPKILFVSLVTLKPGAGRPAWSTGRITTLSVTGM
jgi:hypothetical protein